MVGFGSDRWGVTMQSFHLQLFVQNWFSGRDYRYDDKMTDYISQEQWLTFERVCESQDRFKVNGSLLRKKIMVGVRIGSPIVFDSPMQDVFMRRNIKSGIGGVVYIPEYSDSLTGEARGDCVDANLVLSADIFKELFENRHEVKRLSLQVIGDNVELSYPDGYPSWKPIENEGGQGNTIYIFGMNYGLGSPHQKCDEENGKEHATSDDASAPNDNYEPAQNNEGFSSEGIISALVHLSKDASKERKGLLEQLENIAANTHDISSNTDGLIEPTLQTLLQPIQDSIYWQKRSYELQEQSFRQINNELFVIKIILFIAALVVAYHFRSNIF